MAARTIEDVAFESAHRTSGQFMLPGVQAAFNSGPKNCGAGSALAKAILDEWLDTRPESDPGEDQMLVLAGAILHFSDPEHMPKSISERVIGAKVLEAAQALQKTHADAIEAAILNMRERSIRPDDKDGPAKRERIKDERRLLGLRQNLASLAPGDPKRKAALERNITELEAKLNPKRQ